MPKATVPTLRDAIVFIQSLDEHQLAQLRTDIEIWIYHAEEHLDFVVKYSWFFCGLSAIVALLGDGIDVVALIVAIIVAGLAYTAKSMNSRTTAIVLIVVGVLVGVDVPYRLLAPGQPHDLLLAFAFGTVVLGAAAARTILRLNNLRAFRALIPLPPAKHLLEAER